MKSLYQVEIYIIEQNQNDYCFVIAESMETAVFKVTENLAAKNSSDIICDVELIGNEEGFRSLLLIDSNITPISTEAPKEVLTEVPPPGDVH